MRIKGKRLNSKGSGQRVNKRTIKERLMNKEQWDENASERCENISKSDIGNKMKGE